MFPDLIKIGDFTIHTYGVMVALGLIAAYFTAIYFSLKNIKYLYGKQEILQVFQLL
jgi:prolipoprotein diacylglyceryltransferase